MPSRNVHWHEGMFLGPHHLQAADRGVREALRASEEWLHPFPWGYRALDLDRDAIGSYRAVLRGCRARFKDGTRLSIPEDTEVDPVELKEALERSGEVVLFLAIPALHRGRANVEEHPTADGPRYWIETQEVEDENTGTDEQPVQFRRLRARLLLSGQDQTGYEVLPLARVQRSAHTEAPPQLDFAFVPPLLAMDAWPPLWRQVQSLHYQIGATIEQLAEQVADRGISFESQVPGDAETLLKLSTLNSAFSSFEAIGYLRGMTPLLIYRELCGLAGQLAIYTQARRPPNFPGYDQDNPAPGFRTVIDYIDLALKVFPRAAFHKRYFERAGQRLEVSLENDWLTPNRLLFLGVETELSQEECQALLKSVDMKLGSGTKVERYFEQRVQGLRIEPVSRPPRALPAGAGVVYFQVGRESNPWRDVAESRTLGLRMNLAHAKFQGDRVLAMELPQGGRSAHLQFALYVI
jgi:type VI secretion system protein ImpJ